MDSSTTDVCEWCKRPFLPPGAKVTTRKPAKVGRPAEADKPVAPVSGAPAEPAVPPDAASEAETTRPLMGEIPSPVQEQEEAAPAGPASAADDILRPLGAQPSRAPADSAPFPGTGQTTSGSSPDLSQYMGTDQSIFRPMEKPRIPGTAIGGADALAARRRAAIEREQGPEIPENTRLARAAMAGAGVALVVTLIEFLVNKEVPLKLIVVPISNNGKLTGALMYAALLAVLLGFMLSAMLVRFKLGAFAGLVIGLALGGLALSDNMPWGLIAGGLAGIVTGILASKGLRRVINV